MIVHETTVLVCRSFLVGCLHSLLCLPVIIVHLHCSLCDFFPSFFFRLSLNTKVVVSNGQPSASVQVSTAPQVVMTPGQQFAPGQVNPPVVMTPGQPYMPGQVHPQVVMAPGQPPVPGQVNPPSYSQLPVVRVFIPNVIMEVCFWNNPSRSCLVRTLSMRCWCNIVVDGHSDGHSQGCAQESCEGGVVLTTERTRQ